MNKCFLTSSLVLLQTSNLCETDGTWLRSAHFCFHGSGPGQQGADWFCSSLFPVKGEVFVQCRALGFCKWRCTNKTLLNWFEASRPQGQVISSARLHLWLVHVHTCSVLGVNVWLRKTRKWKSSFTADDVVSLHQATAGEGSGRRGLIQSTCVNHRCTHPSHSGLSLGS